MAIKFFNIKSGEERTVDTEPMIAAFFNSTDQHINALVGQDFGWRLAPETIKRIRQIKSNQETLDRIAQAFSLLQGEVSDTDILRWISLEDARAEAKKTETVQGDFSKEYDEQLRALDTETPSLSAKSDGDPFEPEDQPPEEPITHGGHTELAQPEKADSKK